MEHRFLLTTEHADTYMLTKDGEEAGERGLELDLAIEMLDRELRVYLGRKAPDAIFVHAGVVSRDGVAIVMPAETFAGKTTLLKALARQGASATRTSL